MKHSQVSVGDIELHVVEHGEGLPVLLCHGFPDLARGWRLQMEALAAAGYRAIALDMRGYGRSSAPEDPFAYTPFFTVGDLVGLLDVLDLPSVTVVGHDFGASVAWYAALLRPDRFTAVFAASVPFMPLGVGNFLDHMTAAGAASYYMLEQMTDGAPAKWANTKVTLPSFLYWSSGSPAPSQRWDPTAGIDNMVRPAPIAVPEWSDADDLAYTVAEFDRTGFRGPLNYYRSIPPFYTMAGAFKGLVIEQPSFYLVGELDALNVMRRADLEEMRPGLPGLRGLVEVPGVGHWPNREATELFNRTLIDFLRGL